MRGWGARYRVAAAGITSQINIILGHKVEVALSGRWRDSMSKSARDRFTLARFLSAEIKKRPREQGKGF